MGFALRHSVSILIVVAAAAATAGVFVVATPEHPRDESEMIDFSERDYYSTERVRAAFTAHGIELHATAGPNGFTIFNRRGEVQADALQVLVAPRHGRGSWGPKLEHYAVRFGNVLVTFGERDDELLGRIKAAVEELR